MIASGYTLHLYCEFEIEHTDYHDREGNAEYIGETWGECVKQARKDGWVITKDREAYCKRHSRKRATDNDRGRGFALSSDDFAGRTDF